MPGWHGGLVLLLVLLAAGAWLYRRRRPLQPPVASDPEPPPLPAPEPTMPDDIVRQLFPDNKAIPSQVGAYRVLDRLGSGGMAVVYKVADEQGRLFAMKLPRPAVWAEAEFRKRFRRELAIGTTLSHPNLVGLVEFSDGTGSFPYPYLLMDWVSGRTLNLWMAPGHQQPAENVVLVGMQTLAALEYAHQHNIIHRDIKPGNLMITDDGQVRVMDFGIARQMDGVRLTMTGETVGTPRYMAPEQIEGQPGDGRADIYALGTVLYEMAAGMAPFQDKNYLKMTMAKLKDDPVRLSRHNPQIEPRLERCITKMIARKPEDRHWTADEALTELRALGWTVPRFYGEDGASTPSPDTPTSVIPVAPEE